MLYLLEPSLTLLHNRDPGPSSILNNARADPEIDLGQLRWEPGPQPSSAQRLLRLALIHGIPCSRGIVVDGVLVGVLERSQAPVPGVRRPDPVRPRSQAHQVAVDAWLGTPRHVVVERQVNAARVAAEHADNQRRVEAQAAKLLGGELDPLLLDHWMALGGPEPV